MSTYAYVVSAEDSSRESVRNWTMMMNHNPFLTIQYILLCHHLTHNAKYKLGATRELSIPIHFHYSAKELPNRPSVSIYVQNCTRWLGGWERQVKGNNKS